MKYKIFDVVELYSKEKATIIDINNDTYKVQVTDDNGTHTGVKQIKSEEIQKIIYQK